MGKETESHRIAFEFAGLERRKRPPGREQAIGKRPMEKETLAVPSEETPEQRIIRLEAENAMLRKERDLYKYEAEHDLTTNLFNRRGFIRDLLSRPKGQNGVLLMLDIDDFKGFNKDYGHKGGDVALQAVAEWLSENFRPTDPVGRWGGEEMVVYFPEEKVKNFLKRALFRLPDLKNEDKIAPRINVPINISWIDEKGKERTLTTFITLSGAAMNFIPSKHDKNTLEDAINIVASGTIKKAKDKGKNVILPVKNQ